MTGKVSITIEFDTSALGGYTDETLAMLWHVAQANPADGFDSEEPGDIAMAVGWEIIRRWLRDQPPAMFSHQQRHYHWNQLTKFAKWNGSEWVARDGQPDDLAAEVDLHQQRVRGVMIVRSGPDDPDGGS